MRTTFNAMYRESSAGLEAATERLTAFQRQVSTGKRMEKPSDDPSGTATAITERGELATVEAYKRAATSVGSRLTVVDTILSDIVDKLSTAGTAVLAARGSVQTSIQREATALQLEGVRDTLLENFNTTFQGAYIFGGAAAGGQPFVKDGTGTVQPYAGSVTEVHVDIDRGRSLKVALNGDAITKGTDAQDVFGLLDELIAAARSGDNTILGEGSGKLDAVMQRVSKAQSRVGADLGTVDDQQSRLSQMKMAALTRLDRVEAANMAEAITGMNQSQGAYEAALAAAGAVTRVSLMDYLK